jgi:putative PIN family toxin of toxin-antitoxin system
VKNDLRTVIDTGVVVSAVLLPRSVPRQAFDLAAARGRLLVSDETIAELDDVLRRPKSDKYVSEARRLEFLAALLHEVELIDVVDVVADCRDPKDNKFLELALSGGASHIEDVAVRQAVRRRRLAFRGSVAILMGCGGLNHKRNA